MSHPLEERIGRLRTRVRRLAVLYGASWVVAAVLGAVIVLGLADYLCSRIHFQDRGLRVIGTLLVLGTLGWTGYRFLYLPLVFRLRDVDLALRLQRRFPLLRDRLASAVEFLRQPEDDPMAGSPALRRAVITQTTAETERLDFSGVLNRRPLLRAAVPAVSACLVAAILLGFEATRETSAIAVLRLANPFGNTPWPQKHNLMLCRRVDRVARGRAFEVEIVDEKGAKLPEEVRIHYRFEDSEGNTTEETRPMRFVDGVTAVRGEKGTRARQRKNGVMVTRRENITQPFSYWVEGGDDYSMARHPILVEVVEPPGLESLRINLVPPQYTGWPAQQADRKLIRALVGTRVEVSAEANRPLRSATICLEGGRRLGAGPTGPKQREVAAEFEIEKSGAWWFELVDGEGLAGGADLRWEVRAVSDSPPTVSIERPTTNLFVTPRAVVPLRVVAKDDLAVHKINLVFRRSGPTPKDESKETVWEPSLYAGPERVEPQPAGALSGNGALGERREVELLWELAGLGLSPGIQLDFHATAADYRPQTTTSGPRRLIVITAEELQQRIADRHGQILAALTRVLEMQRGSRSQVQSLEIRLGEIGQLQQLDVDHLQAAELSQRQVNRNLTSRSDGLPMHLLAVLADLENNKLDSPDVQRRMEALLGEIDRLQREHLPVIGGELTGAIKAARVGWEPSPEPPKPDAAVAASLAAAGKHQDQVIAALRRMREQMAQWENYRRFHREISRLLRDQQELAGRTTEVGRRTLTKELKDLPPQDAADLKILATRQLALARQLEGIQQEMEQTGQQLEQEDPLAAETVADALAEARRLAISGQMQSCGGDLADNRIGQAVARQKEIIQGLQEVLDILANRRQHELARLVKKLREAEAELAQIEQQQGGLRKQIEQIVQNPDDAERLRRLQRLGREQQKLQQTTRQMARRLERLLADLAARTAMQAAGQMGQAGECAAQGNPQGACQGAGDAQKSLQEAQRQLAQRRRQAEAELAMEQLARLEDALKHLQTRQQNLIDQTQRYAELQTDGRLTRAQTAGLRDLARQQRTLQTETVQLADQLLRSGVFHMGLSGTARYMGQAAGLLEQGRTGPATLEAENNALRRLELLLEALKPEPPIVEPGNDGGGGEGGDGGGAGAGPGGLARAVQVMAELKLLKFLQQEIQLRTGELQQAVDAAETLTDEQRREYLSLSEEQGRLADMAVQLLKPEEQAPEDDPAGLPDMRIDQQQPPRPLPQEELP